MRLILTTLIFAAFAVPSSADTLTLSVSRTNEYTVRGEAVDYNTLAVRLSTKPCGPRDSTQYEATSPLSEQPVSGTFMVIGSPQTGTLCAYLFAAKTECNPKLELCYPEPCVELRSPPTWCQQGEQAEATFEFPSSPVIPAPLEATPAPAALPPVAVPIVPPTTVPPVTKPKAKAKPKPPVCRRKSKGKHPKCRTRKKSRHVVRSRSH